MEKKYQHIELMLDEIERLGYQRPTIDLLHRTSTPLPPDVVEVILKWLPKIYEDHIGSGEHLIRALITTEKAFNPSVIIDLFENSNLNDALKWTMAYVLSISKAKNISTYIKDQLFNKPSAFKRSGFLASLTKNIGLKDKNELINALENLFDKYYDDEFYFKLFQKYGRVEDISFLESKLSKANKKADQEIYKTIRKIENRKSDNKFPIE